MKKFAVFSGFLGSGKITTMMALTKYYTAHYAKAAMISNDLGEGVTLADHRYASLSGCNASEITDECICFCNELLAERLNALYDDGCELVISDIPGFGVGALEHVYFSLTEKYPGQFELAPFTVLTEPENVALLRSDPGSDRAVICHNQFLEADLIVLNKCDQTDAEGLEEDLRWLREHYPRAEVLAISALRGDGLDALSMALRDGCASLRHPDIDYDADPLQNALGRLSEYYLQYHAVVCCNDFDGTAYLADLAERIQASVRTGGYEIPHMKLLAWGPDGDFGKADILGIGRPIEISRRFKRPCTELAVILNTSAACPFKELDQLVKEAVETVSDAFQLELLIFKKDGFDLSE
jgi:Ni2+-binding GTPase involved in maturation of urease and hydrogenase